MKVLFGSLLCTLIYIYSCEAQELLVKCSIKENDEDCDFQKIDSAEENVLSKRSSLGQFSNDRLRKYIKRSFREAVLEHPEGMRILNNHSIMKKLQEDPSGKCTTKMCLINNILKLANSKLKLFFNKNLNL